MIMGLEQPDGGQLEIGETVSPMYVDQSRDALDPNKTVRGDLGGGLWGGGGARGGHGGDTVGQCVCVCCLGGGRQAAVAWG